MRKLIPVVLVCLFLNIQAQTPQEFLHPDVWLRTDQFDENLDYWSDISGNNYHAMPTENNTNTI